MVYVWLCILIVQLQCVCGGGPLQDEKHWRRPVPGWRQTPESLSLENRGFGFEEADFEVHFSEKGTDYLTINKYSKVFWPRPKLYRLFCKILKLSKRLPLYDDTKSLLFLKTGS